MPNAIVSSTFTKTVLVTNYFYRVRCEAALALVSAYQQLDFLGLFHLFKLFLRYCYDPEDPQQDLFTHSYVPRPNDFSGITEYFVRRVSTERMQSLRLRLALLIGHRKGYFTCQIRKWQMPHDCPAVLDRPVKVQ